eukprot:CAMPEP_0204221894 /NCGR_PEP_ID=MMETSP0361-20130328/81878_1 /ASSEMBLY_ACC=CAM_ASM_000343 /TAXON_ID=268821 /ORGANISM="Scrippsiella Hangoei, Strain SHTV-5" /LENGTH=44 /DNA_ID= /DNA_START= /DNA_END= /DNA_ORIENTATION=
MRLVWWPMGNVNTADVAKVVQMTMARNGTFCAAAIWTDTGATMA